MLPYNSEKYVNALGVRFIQALRGLGGARGGPGGAVVSDRVKHLFDSSNGWEVEDVGKVNVVDN